MSSAIFDWSFRTNFDESDPEKNETKFEQKHHSAFADRLHNFLDPVSFDSKLAFIFQILDSKS